ncbi:MAG: hypothetical protein JST00_09180 [Deltaproteobacteria bacterium]|nr:hypothetical protein [Deltaproteobacteria bacterium]
MLEAPCALDLDVCKWLAIAAKDDERPVAPKLVAALKKKCEPLVEALEASAEEESETEEAEATARYEAALSVPKGYGARKIEIADEAAFVLAMDRLGKTLPKLAKALRNIPRTDRALRGGATTASIAAAEKAIGRKLTPAHRALLSAFDGGSVRELVFLGTEASGARGRDSLVAFARALELRGFEVNPVVRYADKKYGDSLVYTKNAEGAQQLSYLVELTRSSPRLDNLLADVVKAGKLVGSWS